MGKKMTIDEVLHFLETYADRKQGSGSNFQKFRPNKKTQHFFKSKTCQYVYLFENINFQIKVVLKGYRFILSLCTTECSSKEISRDDNFSSDTDTSH